MRLNLTVFFPHEWIFDAVGRLLQKQTLVAVNEYELPQHQVLEAHVPWSRILGYQPVKMDNTL